MKCTFRIYLKGISSKRQTNKERERKKIVRFVERNRIKEKPRIVGDSSHLGGFIVFVTKSKKPGGSFLTKLKGTHIDNLLW